MMSDREKELLDTVYEDVLPFTTVPGRIVFQFLISTRFILVYNLMFWSQFLGRCLAFVFGGLILALATIVLGIDCIVVDKFMPKTKQRNKEAFERMKLKREIAEAWKK